MKVETNKRIDDLKKDLDSKVHVMNKYIIDQYSDEDRTADMKRAFTDHISLLQNVSNRITGFYMDIDRTKKEVHPLNENEWLKNTEKKFQIFIIELDGLK